MGMYDNINFKMVCEDCGEETSDCQSKDSWCTLDTIDPTEVDYFNVYCDCGANYTFSRDAEQRPCREEPFTLSEISLLGFERVK